MFQGSWVCVNDFICSYKSGSMKVYDSQHTFAEVNIPKFFKITNLKIDSFFNIPMPKALLQHIGLVELR